MAVFAPWLSRLVFVGFILVLVGLMPDIAGIDPSQSILRARAGTEQLITPEALQSIRDELGLNHSAQIRLWHWFTKALQGNLGSSWVNGSSVAQSLLEGLSTSLLLMLSALCLSFLFCLFSLFRVGIRFRKNQLEAYQNKFSTLFISLPEYVVALLLMLIFSIWLGVLPPFGWQSMTNIWLPSLALALPATGLLSHLISNSLKKALQEPWVLTWLSANVSLWQIFRFALKRALTSLVPQIALIIIGFTGGAVAVEQIFAIPGIGRLMLGATKAQDLPMLQGGLLLLISFAVLVSSLSILLQKWLLGQSAKSGKLVSAKRKFQLTQNKLKLFTSLVIFLLLAACAIFASMRSPYAIEFSRLATPNFAAPFGADALGRDLLARVGVGMLSTLQLGILATALSFLLGLLLGLFTRLSQGLIEITKALPYMVVGLLVAGLTNMAPTSAFIAIVAVSWASIAAHCSSLVLEAKAQPYAHLAPLWGNSQWRIYRYYLLPFILPPLLRHALLRLPVITLSLTSLSFIGIGAKAPTPEWGLLIAENLPYIERAPQAVLLPILGLVLLTLAINLLFDD